MKCIPNAEMNCRLRAVAENATKPSMSSSGTPCCAHTHWPEVPAISRALEANMRVDVTKSG